MCEVYIVGAKRTAVGTMGGQFSTLTSPELGAAALKCAIEASGIDSGKLDEIFMGSVVTAGVGQAPARQAAMKAGIPLHVHATAVNKVCGSGMEAIILGTDSIRAGSSELVAAGGMECMSRAPHILYARDKHRPGKIVMEDCVLRDGIDNADGRSLGLFCENVSESYGLTREEMDNYSAESTRRSRKALDEHLRDAFIAPVTVAEKGKEKVITEDELPRKISIEHIYELSPSFKENGRLTAATASGFADGAAAIILASEKSVKENHLHPIARIIAHSVHSQEPELFGTAPAKAIEKVLKKAGWAVQDVDYFEINEALAPVPMTAMKDLHIPHDKINIYGGALSMGHPLGASGARITVDLINILTQNGKKRGVASLCIGGGEATALALEII